MRKEVTVGIVVLAIIVVLFLASSFLSITGNVAFISSIEYAGFGCTDSDAHLFEGSYDVKGITIKKSASGGEAENTFEDECASTQRVLEYYCDPQASVKSTKPKCKNGCVDGACVP